MQLQLQIVHKQYYRLVCAAAGDCLVVTGVSQPTHMADCATVVCVCYAMQPAAQSVGDCHALDDLLSGLFTACTAASYQLTYCGNPDSNVSSNDLIIN